MKGAQGRERTAQSGHGMRSGKSDNTVELTPRDHDVYVGTNNFSPLNPRLGLAMPIPRIIASNNVHYVVNQCTAPSPLSLRRRT
jgi:hypothetical protein